MNFAQKYPYINKIIDTYKIFKNFLNALPAGTNIKQLLFQPSYSVVAVLGRLSGAYQCGQCRDGVLHFLTFHNVDGGHRYHCGQ